MLTIHETYMRRCMELAILGAGHVAPNPLVGSVLVHNEKIIGEGYHKTYGEAHAEVNCIHSVRPADSHLIQRATLYVSLEPCSHWGKTPPCTDLILERKIPTVVIGCRDPFDKVNGRGIEKLKNAGVAVELNILEDECVELNKRFLTFQIRHRPYIILKWAQSANAKIANGNFSRVLISNEFTNRKVHKWRSEEAAILIGTNTALVDDPELTVREWKGKNPTRLVIDKDLSLPVSLKIFNENAQTIIFNTIKYEQAPHLFYYQVSGDVSMVRQIVHALSQLNIQSLLVEGGAQLLQSFIDEGMWDEARVITNEELIIDHGLASPELSHFKTMTNEKILSDHISVFRNAEQYENAGTS
jgi:diaminohydroxyphosphoribosylaminopyrimidine deaminase/5-amino-6-(5-phosphoribosylamino)uracil reductase